MSWPAVYLSELGLGGSDFLAVKTEQS